MPEDGRRSPKHCLSLAADVLTRGCEVMEAGRPVEEVYLRAMSGIDPAATIPILKRYLRDEAKSYLHGFVAGLLRDLGD